MEIGFIGLGAMGRGMAASLRRKGHRVHVHDVRPEAVAAFVAEGGVACATPADAARAGEIVISVVVNAAQTEAVLFGADGAAAAMAKGAVFVMCSTVDPTWSIALEERLEAMGLLYLDAPISGGAAKAASGEMTMMTAGRPAAYARCGPALEDMAARVYKLGDRAGAGSTVKIVNQLLAGVHIAAAAEAMALGIRAGVDPKDLYEVITHSAGNSWMFENRMPHVLTGDYTPLSAVDIFVKDLGIVLDTARASKFPLPLASTAHQMFMQASSAGHGREDDAAVIKVFPGIELPAEAMSALKLGCIADDFTGATDLANNLVRSGMRVVQSIGVPTRALAEPVDAVVVALKSRTIPAAEAVTQSLEALAWLQAQGATRFYFKYCSTFDSTARGNIGPVAEALMEALGTDFTIACPAFPENKRTVFKGYLFAGDVPLNESGMQHHPLTPMTDANLVRVLQAQAKRKVGLIDYTVVARGADAVRTRIAQLRADGVGLAVMDAISDDDLRRVGPALSELPLVTAGSGVAIGLPASWGIAPTPQAAELPAAGGRAAILSGSCAAATRGQVRAFIDAGGAALALDPLSFGERDIAAEALAWARDKLERGPVLVYSTAEPAAVQAVQQQLGGVEAAGGLVERVLAAIGIGLVKEGVRRLVVAGGETSGAVVGALGIEQLRIGPQIDPGVPWCAAHSTVAGGTLHLALKSGNFGAPDFFRKSFEVAWRHSAMDEAALRHEICRVGQSLFARGYVHATAGNISVRMDDGFLITPTDACLGFLEPARLSRVDRHGRALSGDRPSKTLTLHQRIYEADAAARCVIHTHSTHLVALTLAGVWRREDIVPPITPYFVMKVGHVPLIPYHRPGDPKVGDLVVEAIARFTARGAPIRAVMLERLGPNVWHESPGAAMAVLEELEETAKLWLLGGQRAEPLDEARIEALRQAFGARW